MRHVSKRNQKLIDEFGGKTLRFRDLPRPAQLSMAYYMAVNGEAWELPPQYVPYEVSLRRINKDFISMLPWFIEEYGDKKFGYVEIPTEELVKAIMADEEMEGRFKEFADYHRWYVKQGGMPRHERRNRWPVILSHLEEETLQDGWHRFHEYIRQGAEIIPALYYVSA